MKKLVLLSVLTLFVFCLYFFMTLSRQADGSLKVVFCDVGQGDAMLIRSPKGVDILIDGGPDQKVLSCLTRHMPFWDRTIELMILTHPHEDHLAGLIDVLDRYTVKAFATEKLTNATASYQALQDKLLMHKVSVKYLYDTDIIRLKEGITLTTLSPSLAFLAVTSPNGFVGESQEFASLILHLTYGTFSVLFTGDSQYGGLSQAILDRAIGPLAILQVPHHGSKTGLTDEILASLNPELAVISVGKNRYGHPAKSILSLLAEHGIRSVRTDGKDRVVMTDGKKWRLE